MDEARIPGPQPLRKRIEQGLLLVVAGLLTAAALVIPHVLRYTTLSPIDELQHIDYMTKGSTLHLVHGGEKVGLTAMRAESCRGIDAPGFVAPPCSKPVVVPGDYQEGGYDTAAQDPPSYYVTTGMLARALVAATPIDDLVTAARLIGIVWLGLGLTVTFVLATSLGASRTAAGASVLLLAGTPAVLLSSATVTSDAPAVVSGAVVTLVTVQYLQGRRRLPWLVAAGLVATMFKVTGLLSLGLCCLLVLVTAGGESPAARLRAAWRPAGALAVGGCLPVLVWTEYFRRTALDAPPSPMTRFLANSIGTPELYSNLLALFPPTQSPYLIPRLRAPIFPPLVAVTGLLIVAAIAAVCLSDTAERLLGGVARCTLAAMLLGGPALVLLAFYGAHFYTAIPARYGLALLPPAMAVLACIATRRRALFAIVAPVAVLQVLMLEAWLA